LIEIGGQPYNTMSMAETIQELVDFIYGKERGKEAFDRLSRLIEEYKKKLIEPDDLPERRSLLPLDQRDAFIICYGDSIIDDPDFKPGTKDAVGVGGGANDDGDLNPLAPKGKRPLEALEKFFTKYLKDVVSGIHILPFFPYSSDDGFSIIDYYKVNPDIGDWDDISKIAGNFRFMCDLVLNHCSAKGPWFREYLKGNPKYKEYFIDLPKDTDVSQIARPRAHPLLSHFEGKDENGNDVDRYIWTTFSRDQVDIQFDSIDVLIQMFDAILFLIEKGTQVVRLDAIAYLWKDLATSSIHLPQTYAVVRLYRLILDMIAPWVVLITETNVPHKENMSYFGNGRDTAHMIYQFSLPPLIFDAFLRGSADHLSTWAKTIPSGPDSPIGYDTTYFNFCASHDGIGMLPAHGILSDEEFENLYSELKNRGGRISYKALPTGKIPYELNINYFSAIADLDLPKDLRVKKFLASQAILLAMIGVPGIYIHSLLGSQNWKEGPEITDHNRTINREKLSYTKLIEELEDPDSIRHGVFYGYTKMLKIRREHKAFHPAGTQSVIDTNNPENICIIANCT
jgi:glycosidase